MVKRTLAGMTNIDQDPQPKKTTVPDGKQTKQGSKEKGGKFVAASRVKKEVEQNPFKTLIDISDLTELEENPKEVEKEV